MKVVFAGTPAFAATSLDALLAAGHEVTLVLTQPDRPAGRGLKPQPSAVKQVALSHRIPLEQPSKLDAAAIAAVSAANPEVIVVAAYGRLVPPALLELPPRGCINVHASLLPRWRGAAPIQHALLAGDTHTGITIMQMDAGLDTGPMLLQEALPIAPDDTAGTLHDKLAAQGARLLLEALAAPPPPQPQDESRATHAPRITKADARIDWHAAAAIIERQVRAYDPAPGAQSGFDGQILKIWRAGVEHGAHGAPGTVCSAGAAGIVIACGRDALRVTELQRAGGRRLTAAQFLAGCRLVPGARLEAADG